ncbi:epoxide hydrolase family protein [Cryptosporangium phraense]|uniref:Epoxide hydrolase n=1 Tax=Cryptosporangium phraense TaxID=2593070 RepID=A0A545B0G9_9ACTN|nr:epoxide hydrolase family protein [Cryptosporangium phraense]TQS47059.1 epoxide hydrolase [Cryptosporangium phraense]
MIEPFRIDVPSSELDDLWARLDAARWPDELPDAGRDYGFPLGELQALASYWRSGYDWRSAEAELNSYPGFRTEIDGALIHFLHVRSPRADALPLLLTHGWPGSIVEFLDVLGPLSEDFHLVVPSLPGFGFSGPTRERGWNAGRVGAAWVALMDRLGYSRYGAHGGDWGSAVSRIVGNLAADRVVGVHLNYLPTPPVEGSFSAEDRARFAQARAYLANQPGVRVLQSQTPQTIAYALTDSPIGQLAWIAERFAEWSDPATPVGVDRQLTDVMLYWLTRTAGSAARLHRETGLGPLPCPVPMGVAVFAHDITRSVRSVAERTYDIRRWSEFDRGGHFAALEVPDLLVDDIRAFFGG